MLQGGNKDREMRQQLRSSFTAPGWSLLHDCRIEVLEL